MTSNYLTLLVALILLDAGARKSLHILSTSRVVLKVVRQIFTAKTQRTELESESHQTKDTRQERVQSEGTVSINVKREMLRHSKELKPNDGEKIRRAKQKKS